MISPAGRTAESEPGCSHSEAKRLPPALQRGERSFGVWIEWARSGSAAVLLSCRMPAGSGCGELVVEQGEAADGRRPAMMAALSLGTPPACEPLSVVGGGRDERVGKAVLVVGRDQPAGLAVV